MFAQYSPLFTSGLLSESNTPSTSRRPSFDLREKTPRESVPVDASSDSFDETSISEHNAVFLTLMPRRRRTDVGHSFLSLDLAESQSMRSMSLRRKDTITSHASHAGRSAPSSPSSPPMPFASFSQFGSAALSRKSLARRSSRENLPGAKPAPSSQLPAVPAKRARPSDLSLTLSTCFSPLATSSSSSSNHRSTHSEPSVLSPISPLLSPIERSYFAFSPVSPVVSNFLRYSADEAPRSAPAVFTHRTRPSMRSTASSRTRQVNRSAALAALEGRAARKARPRSRPNNFMSMSDDEDDDESDSFLHSPPVSVSVAVQPTLLEVLQEEEDVVVPSVARPTQKRLSPPKKTRSRRGTIESLLSPLTNFIDFKDDEGSSRGWRSFVEIS